MEEFSSKGYLDMELLRFTTAGSVDDGKSTLIGRLLYDSKSIFEDQLEAVKRASILKGNDYMNLALLTDGLRAEREQGITIDVAYRYFATPQRKFIIADTPGHIQYTRNMVTGASTANAALILVDARNGVIEQTRRHSYIASMLGIPHIIVCINKMDLVDYSEKVYNDIKNSYANFTESLKVREIRYVPISALHGDNVVDPSGNMPWYTGITLRNMLETIDITSDYNFTEQRFPVQYVIRPISDEFHDYRGYAGRIAGGIFHKGDEVTILPSANTSRIKSLDVFENDLEQAYPPMSVSITLEDDIDISRGDMIAGGKLPSVSQELDVMICWFNLKPLQENAKYAIKHNTHQVRGFIKAIVYKINISSLDEIYDDKVVKMNEIARITLKTTKPLIFDSYQDNRITGSLILIDEATNETVGAGMIL